MHGLDISTCWKNSILQSITDKESSPFDRGYLFLSHVLRLVSFIVHDEPLNQFFCSILNLFISFPEMEISENGILFISVKKRKCPYQIQLFLHKGSS